MPIRRLGSDLYGFGFFVIVQIMVRGRELDSWEREQEEGEREREMPFCSGRQRSALSPGAKYFYKFRCGCR